MKSTQWLGAFSVDIKIGFPNVLKAAENIRQIYSFKLNPERSPSACPHMHSKAEILKD
jgi:hypothetical protein